MLLEKKVNDKFWGCVPMYYEGFSKRLAELRQEKGVSARDMSLSLGQSESYINKIENIAKLIPIIKDAQTGEITLDSPTAIPFVNHYIKAEEVASDDKGYRDYTIYLLKDYTEDLAAIHGAHSYEAQNGTTLEGGAFSKQNLINTYNKYIAAEFHPIDN